MLDQLFIYILQKIMNRKQLIEINIMISYSYKTIVVSIMIINLLYVHIFFINKQALKIERIIINGTSENFDLKNVLNLSKIIQ